MPDRREMLKMMSTFGAAWLMQNIIFAQISKQPLGDFKKKKFAKVFGKKMAYVEAGKGDPIVFLHGNPTSSYLWRNVIPAVEKQGRCIAPDLIGMGDSDKLKPSGETRYHFVEHRKFLAELLKKLKVKRNVILVVHDWGGSLGFDWAMNNKKAIKGIVFMETFIVSQNSSNTPEETLEWFKSFRTEEGKKKVLEDNHFVELVLLRQFPNMSEEDKTVYRKPFLEAGESRRPTLVFPQQVPINGKPKDVHQAIIKHLEWMAKNDIPKLFIKGDPGALISRGREKVCRKWKNITEVEVKGLHYLPEESPKELGQAISEWLEKL